MQVKSLIPATQLQSLPLIKSRGWLLQAADEVGATLPHLAEDGGGMKKEQQLPHNVSVAS